MVLETASGVCVHGYEKGRHVGAEGAFSVRTVYPWLSREQPPSTVTWCRCASATGCSRGFRAVSGGMGRSPIGGPASPTEHFDEGEQVYLGIAPEHCVLLEA